MRHHDPFTSSGTATFPGHRFIFTPQDEPDNVLIRFIMGEYPENVYAYDPYHVEGDPEQTEKNLQVLSKGEREKYDRWRKTLLFNEQYLNFTGRSYLANYLRAPPSHFMWPAEHFGQEHWVTTKETHFVKEPPADLLQPVAETGEARVLREEDPRILQEYRVPDQSTMNMTLKVVSVAPRVLEIPNFLSPVEVDHVLELAAGIKLSLSLTGEEADRSNEQKKSSTRTSYNSWVPREKSPVIDAIYRRAADLLRIDEALLRLRGKSERPDVKVRGSIAEDLQLVHYQDGQGKKLSMEWLVPTLWRLVSLT
jgi:hypothetical protein